MKQTIEVKVSEIKEMNDFILQIIDIDVFVKTVEQHIMDIVRSNPEEYVDEEGEGIVDENVIDQAVEHCLEIKFATTSYPTIIYEAVHERINKDLLEELEQEVMEIFKDNKAYRKDPLGYHGMKQSDFL